MSAGPRTPLPMRREDRVTSLELFFDLVFVFAVTQVSTLLARHPSPGGVVRGLLVLALVWWAWAAYSWLTSTIDPDDETARLAMFAAMGGMLIVSIALPGLYGSDAAVFVAAYAVVRLAHLALYLIAARGDAALRNAMLRLGASSAIAVFLLAVAASVGGNARVAVVALAVAIDWGGALVGRGAGWRLHPHHFAERYGLIVLIAIGESIVSVGIGASERTIDAALVVGALCGLATAAALWWAYFDVVAPVAERRLASLEGRDQALLARDSYSYLHYGLVAGIVLYAFGAKEALLDVHGHLSGTAAACLGGGVAVYLLAQVAFRLRNLGTWNPRRLVVAVVLLAIAPIEQRVPALAAIALVAALVVALIAYEALRFGDARRRIREGGGGMVVRARG